MRRVLAAVAVGAATLAATPATAYADQGDGRAACNRGEICFQSIWDRWTTSAFQKHFYYSDTNHHNDYWGNVVPEGNTTYTIANNASGFWNRDTECSVAVYDGRSYGGGALVIIPRGNMTSIRDANESHKRCP